MESKEVQFKESLNKLAEALKRLLVAGLGISIHKLIELETSLTKSSAEPEDEHDSI